MSEYSDEEIISDSENKTIGKTKKSIWRDEQEDILKKWADKALCYKSMHDRCVKKYWCLNAWFNIPIIILSTLTGTGNFAQKSFDPSYANLLIILIGAANIIAALLGTISQYINVAGSLEGHKFAAISWDKYARGVQVELSKVRNDRQDALSYLKRCQEEFDRLIEISPDFPSDVIDWFNKLINTGEFLENNQCCGVYCYECFCLPFGFRGCRRCKTCDDCCGQDNEKEIKKRNFKELWNDIELPEVLGCIKPTKIVREEKKLSNNKYRVESFKNDIDV